MCFINHFSKKWHQLASTASDRKGTRIQYDISWFYPPKKIFSKHKNKAEFKYLDEFEVLSSDFPGLKTSAASMTSVASAASMASMTSTASFYIKNSFLWFDHPWHQNDQYWSISVEWIIKNHSFLLSLAPFLWEAVEASQC